MKKERNLVVITYSKSFVYMMGGRGIYFDEMSRYIIVDQEMGWVG